MLPQRPFRHVHTERNNQRLICRILLDECSMDVVGFHSVDVVNSTKFMAEWK